MTVVDARVVVDGVAPGDDPESAALAALHHRVEAEEELLEPRLLLEKVAKALLTGVRLRRWTGSAADEAFHGLHRLPLRSVEDRRDLDRAWDLSRRYDDHPIYDML